MSNIEEIAKSVQSNGIFKKENWLSLSDEKKARKIVLSIKPKKGDKSSWVSHKIFSHIIKLCKLDFKSLNRSYFFLRLANKLRLKNIAEKIFKDKAELCGIDFYYNQQSNEPVLDWHCDTANSGKKDVKKFINEEDYAIKFFFYLTDVSADNGCLSYIPKSNRITYALKKGIFEGKLDYTPYWSLQDYREAIKKKEYYEYIKNIVGESSIIDFLDATNFQENKDKKQNSFDNEIKKGGAIIFDETGVHRGSKTKFNDRIAFRFFYKKKYLK